MRVEYIVLIVVGVACLLAAQGIYYLIVYRGERRRAEVQRRLHDAVTPGEVSSKLSREHRVSRIPAIDQLLRPMPVVRWLEQLLLQTDLSWTVASTFGFGFLLAIGLTLLLFFGLRQPFFMSILGIPAGVGLPLLLVLNARTKRSQMMSKQLPDALDMMIRSLRAGHGLSASFNLVAKEMPSPVAMEFGRCFEDQKFGLTLRDSVLNMMLRVPENMDVKIFAVSIVLQGETGGNLVEILDRISSMIRGRFKFYGRLRTLTAEGKYSGYILGSLPFVCLLLISLFNPTYLAPLIGDPIGRLLSLGGLVMWVLGILWMKKMVRIDY